MLCFTHCYVIYLRNAEFYNVALNIYTGFMLRMKEIILQNTETGNQQEISSSISAVSFTQ